MAIFVRDDQDAPWRYGTHTSDPRIVDQYRHGITSGPENLAVLALPTKGTRRSAREVGVAFATVRLRPR